MFQTLKKHFEFQRLKYLIKTYRRILKAIIDSDVEIIRQINANIKWIWIIGSFTKETAFLNEIFDNETDKISADSNRVTTTGWQRYDKQRRL